MTLEQAFHICRAAASIANVEYVFVFGSNAIVFWLDKIGLKDTAELMENQYLSRELDLSVSEEDEQLNLLVDATIGELSMFDATFGVYAHANPSKGLFKAPKDWISRARLIKDPIRKIKIIAPHPLDLVFSKMLGMRDKDWFFCQKVFKKFRLSFEDLEKMADLYIKEHPEETEKVRLALKVLSSKINCKSLTKKEQENEHGKPETTSEARRKNFQDHKERPANGMERRETSKESPEPPKARRKGPQV